MSAGQRLAWVTALLAMGCSGRAKIERPNVVLIVIDTLRKDALHLYGNPLETSKAIDALGASGWVFDRHVAHASQTVPSTLSLLLSRLPAEHGFIHERMEKFSEELPRYPDEFLFLAEVFRGAGYATSGWVANPHLTRKNGFDQGFDRFEYMKDSSRRMTGLALDWMQECAKDRTRPFFAYLHLMDPHQPYEPPKAVLQRFTQGLSGKALSGNRPLTEADQQHLAWTRAAYLAAVSNADAQVDAVVRKLRELGLEQNSIIVVTSDHGEEFGEHGGLGHGTTVYGELVRVPLVIAYPPALTPPRRVRELTQHVDLAPTILSLAGIEPPREFRGTSVLEQADRAFTEDGPWRAVYGGDWKLVLNLDTGEPALFSATDELDQHSVTDAESAQGLRRELDEYLSIERPQAVAPTSMPSWSADELDHLRKLGYTR